MHWGHHEHEHAGMTRIPLFPFIPLFFPIGVFLSLLGLIAWFSYLSYKELAALRHEEMRGPRPS